MSDSTRPASSGPGDDRPGVPPVPPAPPAPPVPPTQSTPGSGASTPPYYGSPSTGPSQGAPTPGAYPSAPGAYPSGTAPYGGPAGPPRTLSLIGMIAGIVGLVVSVPGAGFGFIFSVAAVVLGFLGRKRESYARGFWLTAIITGFVGIAVSLAYLAFFIIIIAIGASASSSYTY